MVRLNVGADHPEVVEAIDRVGRACQQRDISLGYFGTTAESVQAYASEGYHLICAGTDAGFVLGDGVWEGLRQHKGALLFLDAHIDRLYRGADVANSIAYLRLLNTCMERFFRRFQ